MVPVTTDLVNRRLTTVVTAGICAVIIGLTCT